MVLYMVLFDKLRAAYLGAKLFHKVRAEKHNEVVELYEELFRLDPDQKFNTHSYYYFARSLVAVGQLQKAYNVFTKGYNLFVQNREENIYNSEYQSDFVWLVKDYIAVLEKLDKYEQSIKVSDDLRDWKAKILDNGTTGVGPSK